MSRAPFILAAATVFAVCSVPAIAAPAYLGGWTVFDTCTPAEVELRITRTMWSEVNSECSIRSVSGGNGVWRFNLHKCQGDGVKKTSTVKVTVKGNKLTQQVGGQTYKLTRCR